VRGPAIVPGLPILEAGIRRIAVAAGMHPDRVAVVAQAGAVHLLQVGRVADGRGRLRTGGGRRAADDDHAGTRGLDGPVGGGQQAHIARRVQRLIAPLVMQVLFIPHFDGLHAAAIAPCKLTDEAGVGVRVRGRPFDTEIGACRSRPLGRLDDAGKNLDAVAVERADDIVRPVALARPAALEILPRQLELHPAKAQPLDAIH